MKKRKKVASGNGNKAKHEKSTKQKKSAKKSSKKVIQVSVIKASKKKTKKKKKAKRAGDGKWLKGVCYNTKGRPKGMSQKDMLLLAITQTEREKQKPLYKHYAEQGYTDNVILKDIVGKFVPNKKHVEITDDDEKMSVEMAKSIQDKQRAKVSA